MRRERRSECVAPVKLGGRGVDCAGLVESPWPAKPKAVRLGSGCEMAAGDWALLLLTVGATGRITRATRCVLGSVGGGGTNCRERGREPGLTLPLVCMSAATPSGSRSWRCAPAFWWLLTCAATTRLPPAALLGPTLVIRLDNAGEVVHVAIKGPLRLPSFVDDATDSFSFDASAARDGFGRAASACFLNYDAVRTGGIVQIKWFSAIGER